MQEEHRSAIRDNFSSLVEQTDLDTMVSILYEKGVFSEAMIEPYQDASKDQRSRKRQLYMDIQRRGPDAFRHLLDALTENGAWDLVRALEPGSLPTRAPRPLTQPASARNSSDSEFLSIPQAKRNAMGKPCNKNPSAVIRGEQPPAPAPPPKDLVDRDDVPKFHVIKSTKFMEDNGKDIKLYRMRGRRRGVLVVFSYIKFEHEIEAFRRGVDVDCQKLKYLFDEMGFEVISFQNLTKQETLTALANLPLAGAESLFVVVSSHGHASPGSAWLTDIRVSNGSLVSTMDFQEHLNNVNCPALRGVPKVFIFQMCRGTNGPAALGLALDGAPARASPPPRAAPRPSARDFTDMLIAHSTLPGYVSHRDVEAGSWYIQVLCEVFAAHAHARHVEALFTLVDQQLQDRFGLQTSDVQKWGFNRKLYLHPGLFEDEPPPAPA